jgi:hypothetical protein
MRLKKHTVSASDCGALNDRGGEFLATIILWQKRLAGPTNIIHGGNKILRERAYLEQ